jgi:hypothetical protein
MRTDLPQLGARLSCVDVLLDRQSAQSTPAHACSPALPSQPCANTARGAMGSRHRRRFGPSLRESHAKTSSRISNRPFLPFPVHPIPFLLPLHPLLSTLPPPPSHPLSLYVSVSLAHRLLAVGASFVTISLTTTLCIETDALRLFTVARTNKRVHPKLMFTHTTHDNSVAAPIRALAPPTHTSTKHTRVLAPVLLSLSHSLRRISNGINDHARARAWIRLAINECGLESYVASLAQDTDTLATYYEPWAFLRDSESMSKVILLPVAVFFLGPSSPVWQTSCASHPMGLRLFVHAPTKPLTHPPPTHPPTHSHLLPSPPPPTRPSTHALTRQPTTMPHRVRRC